MQKHDHTVTERERDENMKIFSAESSMQKHDDPYMTTVCVHMHAQREV
jgi:hypothetical protein